MKKAVSVKTKFGSATIAKSMISHQEKILYKKDVVHILHLTNGNKIELKNPVDKIDTIVVNKRKNKKNLSTEVQVSTIEYNPPKLPSAESCPSAGTDIMVVGVKRDESEKEKYKGEMFFTHKTAPGLVIKSAEGQILHETKMSDMYKRRD